MDALHILLLGLVQGITEFLPVSSSAHLILLPVVFGWADQGLAHDMAAHFGTLAAVLLYFRKEFARIVAGAASPARSGAASEGRLLWLVIVATLPIVAAGLLLHDAAETFLRSPIIIGAASAGFGLVLWVADRTGARRRGEAQIDWKDAVLIGLAQCLAIIPGTSRSGVTMMAALLLGFDRTTASRFSFYLAVPTILLAVVYEIYFVGLGAADAAWSSLSLVFMVSGASAWFAIHYFLKFIERTGMTPYVIYRVVLGLVLLAIFIE